MKGTLNDKPTFEIDVEWTIIMLRIVDVVMVMSIWPRCELML